MNNNLNSSYYYNIYNILTNKYIEKTNTIEKKINNIEKNTKTKKTPKSIKKYITKNYTKTKNNNNKIIKNIIKKIDRDDFDILLDLAKNKIKKTKITIYGLLIHNKSKNINKLLYHNKKTIKLIVINDNMYINTVNMHICDKENIFELTNKFYSILKKKEENNYIASKYTLLIFYISIIIASIFLHNINNLSYLVSNITSISRKISNFIKITKEDKTKKIEKNSILSIDDINIINNALIELDTEECEYTPIPINISLYTKKKENSNILKFSETTNTTIKFINNIFIKETINWATDSKTNIIFSKLIPTGSGWYRLFNST